MAGCLCPPFFGTLPTVLYIALPMAVGVAVALEFARMSADGMIAALYSLRLSVWAITSSGCFVAIVAVGGRLLDLFDFRAGPCRRDA